MPKSQMVMRLAVAVLLVCSAIGLTGWGLTRSAADEEAQIGRYQVAAPDLVLDTATGKLTTGKGQVLETPIQPTSTEVGRYSVSGYITAVTRFVGLDMLNQPTTKVDLVKGYVLGDTKTGRIIKQRIYHSEPLQPGEL